LGLTAQQTLQTLRAAFELDATRINREAEHARAAVRDDCTKHGMVGSSIRYSLEADAADKGLDKLQAAGLARVTETLALVTRLEDLPEPHELVDTLASIIEERATSVASQILKSFSEGPFRLSDGGAGLILELRRGNVARKSALGAEVSLERNRRIASLEHAASERAAKTKAARVSEWRLWLAGAGVVVAVLVLWFAKA
jgi:hypothetical protein